MMISCVLLLNGNAVLTKSAYFETTFSGEIFSTYTFDIVEQLYLTRKLSVKQKLFSNYPNNFLELESE